MAGVFVCVRPYAKGQGLGCSAEPCSAGAFPRHCQVRCSAKPCSAGAFPGHCQVRCSAEPCSAGAFPRHCQVCCSGEPCSAGVAPIRRQRAVLPLWDMPPPFRAAKGRVGEGGLLEQSLKSQELPSPQPLSRRRERGFEARARAKKPKAQSPKPKAQSPKPRLPAIRPPSAASAPRPAPPC